MGDPFAKAAAERSQELQKAIDAVDLQDDFLKKPWHPKDISPAHKHIIGLAAAGLKNKEIAEHTRYSENRVSIILSHPDARRLVATLSTDMMIERSHSVRAMLDVAAVEAMQKNIHLMRNANSEAIQQRSVFDILDRAGYEARDINVNANFTLPKDEIDELRKTLSHIETPLEVREEVEHGIEALIRENSGQP